MVSGFESVESPAKVASRTETNSNQFRSLNKKSALTAGLKYNSFEAATYPFS
jgi:hypothetical protein